MDERVASRQVLQLTKDVADLWNSFHFTNVETRRLRMKMTEPLGIGYMAAWSLYAGAEGKFYPYDGIEYVKKSVAKIQATLQRLNDALGGD